MNKSFSKIRHIQSSNILLERRILNENPSTTQPAPNQPAPNQPAPSTTPPAPSNNSSSDNTKNNNRKYTSQNLPALRQHLISLMKDPNKPNSVRTFKGTSWAVTAPVGDLRLDLPDGSYIAIDLNN
jgi:hypothetical protein